MKILAFETSCDDTSIALFEDDVLIAMDTASQIKIHEQTWWVVPEIAAREHANNIFKVLDNVLKNSKQSLGSIDYIAVTMTPWLMPSLLTGITVARTISISLNIPLIEINHIESHIFSNYIDRKEKDITYPLVCLTVSGGHNEIYYMKDMFDFNKVWWTQDDSAGEAFDKVAKMMWLWYPGGPIISELAEEYLDCHPELVSGSIKCKNHIKKNNEANANNNINDSEINSEWQNLCFTYYSLSSNLFPRSWLNKDELNFSFSGLKSSVKREVDKRIEKKWKLSIEDRQEIAFEFQEAVTEVLATKLVNAAEKYNTKTVMLAWWVSANDRLKEYIEKLIVWKDIKFIYPIKKVYSMDNAAMVWINAYYKITKKD